MPHLKQSLSLRKGGMMSHLGLRILNQSPEVLDAYKATAIQQRSCTCELTSIVGASTRPMQDQARENHLNVARGGGHKVLPLVE